MNDSIDVISTQEAARLLTVSRATLFRLLKTGKLPSRKLGRRTLISRGDVQTLLAGLPERGAE